MRRRLRTLHLYFFLRFQYYEVAYFDPNWDVYIIYSQITTELDDSSSTIEFEADSKAESVSLPSDPEPTDPEPTRTKSPSVRIQQALYIQMEFCEKSTLRQAIDNCLYLENIRAWRLFREIIDGLAHVHAQGILHRDLKPVNIFLDSNDHVKIGDFGLATAAVTSLTKPDGKDFFVYPNICQSYLHLLLFSLNHVSLK